MVEGWWPKLADLDRPVGLALWSSPLLSLWELWEREQEEPVQINQLVKPDLVDWFEI